MSFAEIVGYAYDGAVFCTDHKPEAKEEVNAIMDYEETDTDMICETCLAEGIQNNIEDLSYAIVLAQNIGLTEEHTVIMPTEKKAENFDYYLSDKLDIYNGRVNEVKVNGKAFYRIDFTSEKKLDEDTLERLLHRRKAVAYKINYNPYFRTTGTVFNSALIIALDVLAKQ